MRIVEIFEVVGNTDDIEGKGSDVTLGYFDNFDNASTFAKGKGVFGSNALIRKSKGVKYDNGNIYHIQRDKPVNIAIIEGKNYLISDNPIDYNSQADKEFVENILSNLSRIERAAIERVYGKKS